LQKVQHDKLVAQERFFRETFDHAPNGIALVTLNGDWITVNNEICEIFGYDRTDLFSQNFLYHVIEEDKSKITELILAFEGSNSEAVKTQIRIYTKIGIVKWLNLSISAIHDSNGKVEHHVYQLDDITQLKTANQEISVLLDKSRDQNNRLLNFANIVSHNLRSNSANLSMLLNIIELEHKSELDAELLSMLKEGIGGLEKTIENLNEVVQVQTNTSNQTKSIDLCAAVDQSIKNIKILILESDVTINNEIPKGITVKAVPAYLDSILMNLLSNSIKYRSLKRDSIVDLSAKMNNGYTYIEVKDNGLGMDMNTMGDKLFGMYKTFHGNEDAKGLGLFLTKSHINSLGGSIHVESAVDEGTTFKIKLKS
jgi:PAS domain S-box-containing protein